MGVADDPLKDEGISIESKDGANLCPMPAIVFRREPRRPLVSQREADAGDNRVPLSIFNRRIIY